MMCAYCHRRGRVTASGGEVRRLSLAGGVEVKMLSMLVCILNGVVT